MRRQLEKASNVSLADFLAYDLVKTTGKRFTNPNGYYVHLAKEWVAIQRQRLREAALDPLRQAAANAPPEPVRDAKGNCAKCGGDC